MANTLKLYAFEVSTYRNARLILKNILVEGHLCLLQLVLKSKSKYFIIHAAFVIPDMTEL
jgi:hypothetical protein